VLLVAATAYEALVAAGSIELGSDPGAGPPGEGIVLALSLGAMLAGAIFALVRPSALAALVAPAAAAFLVARFYTFDPYYLPALRRMSDDGLVSPALVFLVAALAAGVAALSVRLPRAASYLSVPVVLGAAFLARVLAGGH
jgi:hypothetical protein